MVDDLTDEELLELGRQFARIRRALPDLPHHEPRNLHDAPRLETRPRFEGPDDVRTPQLRPVFDFGQIGTIVSIVSAAIGVIWWGSAQSTTFTQQIARQTDQIVKIQADITAINVAAAERTKYYGPRIDKVEADNQVQNERLQNAAAAILELRRQGSDLMSILSVMREDIATIKASRLGPSRRTELAPPTEPR